MTERGSAALKGRRSEIRVVLSVVLGLISAFAFFSPTVIPSCRNTNYFICFFTKVTEMLQAGDRAKYPLIALAAGGGAKIAFELIFITTPMGIYAVSISNIICFGIAGTINTIFALRMVGIRGELLKFTPRLLALAALYLVLLWVMFLIVPGGRWWVLPAGMAALVFYVFLSFCLKLFDRNEKKCFHELRTG